MNETAPQAYLQQVFALDARSQAEDILRLRREFLNSDDVVVATLSDNDDGVSDLRTRLLERLNDLRREFWSLESSELSRRLDALQNVANAETVATAMRLQRVATHREPFRRLLAVSSLDLTFVQALAAILIAPASEANRVREREHSRLRPERNDDYHTTRHGVQATVRFIRVNYPQVFELEEAWLTELLEYDPSLETVSDSEDSMFGLMILGGIGLTVFANVAIVLWVFS